MSKDALLYADDISKRFGGIQALNDVHFELKRGEVHALVGANGAGKSTLMKVIAGAIRADEGKISLEGRHVSINNPSDAQLLGISAVYQEFSLVNSLSVAENIFLNRLPVKSIFNFNAIQIVQPVQLIDKARQVLRSLDCGIDPRTMVRNLTVAEKQMVEIAKALSNQCKVLMLDEPTASLTDDEINNLFKIVKSLTAQGMGVIYVSHRLEELPLIADRITVMRDGRNVITLPIREAPKDVIIKHMVGAALEHQPRTSKAMPEIMLEVRGLTQKPRFYDISFKVHKGEILGITGLAGAGRTEMARAIFGLDKLDSGEIFIEGKEVEIRSPQQAKSMGISFVTENRKEEGLVLGLDIKNNVAITILPKLTRGFTLNSALERETVNNYVEAMSIKASGIEQKVKNLSGGNQQKVVIAKWLATQPKVLIMDEPTKGIDVASKGQIYGILNRLADQGVAIIVISSEIPEILEVSDRILVMAAGRITAELSPIDATQDMILHYATIKASAEAV